MNLLIYFSFTWKKQIQIVNAVSRLSHPTVYWCSSLNHLFEPKLKSAFKPSNEKANKINCKFLFSVSKFILWKLELTEQTAGYVKKKSLKIYVNNCWSVKVFISPKKMKVLALFTQACDFKTICCYFLSVEHKLEQHSTIFRVTWSCQA